MKPIFDIRKMEPQDLEEVAYLSSSTISNDWDEKQISYEANENPFCTILVCRIDGHVVAFLDYWVTFDSSTIAEIAVSNKYRRQGIATSLLDKMKSDLVFKNVRTCTLEVRESNGAAKGLYLSFGFHQECTKEHYYDDGENATYMVMEVKE